MPGARGRRFVGVLVVTAGILVLIDRAGDAGRLIYVLRMWWPIGLAAFAVANLATFLRKPVSSPSGLPNRWPVLASIGLLLLACVILLGTTGFLRFELTGYFLPAALIGAGLLLTLWEGSWEREHQTSVAVTAILRRSVLAVTAKGVYHVRVRALLGDVQLDLSGSELINEAKVHATVWRGRIHLRCPASWAINKIDPIGRGIEIRGPKPASAASPPSEHDKKLFVHTMGGHGVVVLTLAED